MEDIERALLPTDLDRDWYELGKMVWLLKKWTSVTYIRRIEVLIEKFQTGTEKQFSNTPRIGIPKWFREVRRECQMFRAGLESVQKKLLRGDYSVLNGIADQYSQSISFDITWFCPKYDANEFAIIGEKQWPHGPPSDIPFRFAELAYEMSLPAKYMLEYRMEYPDSFFRTIHLSDEFRFPVYHAFPEYVPPHINEEPEEIGPDEEVSATGIWLPVGQPHGCPNYFVAGRERPPLAQIPVTRIETPAPPEPSPLGPPLVYHEYDAIPTRWRLIWRENRYRDGKVPLEEREYLGAAEAIPGEG